MRTADLLGSFAHAVSLEAIRVNVPDRHFLHDGCAVFALTIVSSSQRRWRVRVHFIAPKISEARKSGITNAARRDTA